MMNNGYVYEVSKSNIYAFSGFRYNTKFYDMYFENIVDMILFVKIW